MLAVSAPRAAANAGPMFRCAGLFDGPPRPPNPRERERTLSTVLKMMTIAGERDPDERGENVRSRPAPAGGIRLDQHLRGARSRAYHRNAGRIRPARAPDHHRARPLRLSGP